MFYEPPHRDEAQLPHDPLKAIVAPRPIGWISTVFAAGVANLAPYSFSHMLSENPWIVGFCSNAQKDSMRNIAETGEFDYNRAAHSQIDEANRRSVPALPEIDEFALLGIDSAKSHKVKPRRVAASPCAFDCKWIETTSLKGVSGKPTDWFLVLREVVGVHIDESAVESGKVDIVKLQSLARCRYINFTWVQSVVPRNRSTWP